MFGPLASSIWRTKIHQKHQFDSHFKQTFFLIIEIRANFSLIYLQTWTFLSWFKKMKEKVVEKDNKHQRVAFNFIYRCLYIAMKHTFACWLEHCVDTEKAQHISYTWHVLHGFNLSWKLTFNFRRFFLIFVIIVFITVHVRSTNNMSLVLQTCWEASNV